MSLLMVGNLRPCRALVSGHAAPDAWLAGAILRQPSILRNLHRLRLL